MKKINVYEDNLTVTEITMEKLKDFFLNIKKQTRKLFDKLKRNYFSFAVFNFSYNN